MQTQSVSIELLRHVLADECEDPDCEIHHVEVGLREDTVTPANLAFYLAGAFEMEKRLRRHFHRLFRGLEGYENARERIITASLYAGRPMMRMGDVVAFGCSDCGAPAGQECYPEFGCARFSRTVA